MEIDIIYFGFFPYFILKEDIFSLFFLSDLLKKKWKIKKENQIHVFKPYSRTPHPRFIYFIMTTNLLFDSFVWASRLIIRFPPWFFFLRQEGTTCLECRITMVTVWPENLHFYWQTRDVIYMLFSGRRCCHLTTSAGYVTFLHLRYLQVTEWVH